MGAVEESIEEEFSPVVEQLRSFCPAVEQCVFVSDDDIRMGIKKAGDDAVPTAGVAHEEHKAVNAVQYVAWERVKTVVFLSLFVGGLGRCDPRGRPPLILQVTHGGYVPLVVDAPFDCKHK